MLALAKLLLAYLLGSLSGSLLLGRVRGVDIRTQGSGNAGGTNALRTQGWRFALGVAAIDLGKGALAAWLGLAASGSPSLALACVFAATLGHVHPLYFGFRGGKGAATLAGGIAVLLPLALAPLFALWLLVLLASGYVGLATICAALTLPFAALLAPLPLRGAFALFGVAAALLVLWTHRGNLARLRAGNEHRFERVRVLPRLLKRGG